jgi:hypothetical protein
MDVREDGLLGGLFLDVFAVSAEPVAEANVSHTLAV